MFAPKINDWISCRGFDYGPGKVFAVDMERKMFRAFFLDEPDIYPSISESDWLSFSIIEYIITDSEKIAELEKEHKGEG
jgi:hypothetical protein